MKLHPLFRFGLVGTLAFGLDVSILYALLYVNVDYFSGRAISFLITVFFTWQLNRRFTFSVSGELKLWQEAWRYFVSASFGGAVNYATYSLVIIMVKNFILLPLIAVALGSIAGMGINYIAAKKFVFPEKVEQK